MYKTDSFFSPTNLFTKFASINTASQFGSLRGKLTNISTNLSEKVKLPDRFKGTFVERWSIYWKSLANDYLDVARGAVQTAKEKPLRTSILGAVGLTVYICAKTNPGELDLIEAIRQRNGDILMVHESCQRPESAEYLKLLQRSINQGTLRTLDLGVLTLVWLHDFNKDLSTYRAQCEYLQPEYSTFHQRIIDVGFLNKWWNLDRKMIDYDVAEDNL